MPKNPTKNGWIFMGWYKDEEFTQVFTFGADGEKITKNITLYAQWLDADLLVAKYAASEIVIGYSAGDNPKYVTGNLELPAKIDGVDITWDSNSSAGTSDGIVNRQATDVNVMLTATATYNNKSAEKSFDIKVIKKRIRKNNEINALSLGEASSGDIVVERNTSGHITDIEGQYVSFDIDNADDALDAVTVLKNELGIKNPEKEFEPFSVTSDIYSSEYKFQQVYNGVRVLGRRIMISTNSNNKGDFLHSSLLSSDIIENANMQINRTSSDAENIAKNYYSGEFEVDSSKTEKIIYSLEDFEEAPVYVYIVNIFGTKSDGNYIDEKFFIHADSNKGNIIESFSNINNAIDGVTNWLETGQNERGSWDVFPVTISNNNEESQMVDTSDSPTVEIHKIDWQFLTFHSTSPLKHRIGKKWDDPQAVSAYVNMREIMKWWKDTFIATTFEKR